MTSFNDLLRAKPYLLLAGAHNGLSARLAAQAGFDALWASGFEISASHAVPDANILTMSESLEAAKDLHQAAPIPILADCDNGYGNAVNVRRTVQEYERAGLAGICIEDNNFPKRCSFYTGVKRDLVSVEEHAGKVRAAVETRRSADFWIVARTEALIAGLGMEEALRRARAYADAGADAILIHSRQKAADEILEFARLWRRDTPLVAVPTTYGAVAARELHAAGFRVVIFANHGMRACVRAMRETFDTLRREERTAAVDPSIATLEDIHRLVGVSVVQETERAYLPRDATDAKAVVLAAGFDRLAPDRPKAMLDVRGRPILHQLVDTLRACGVHDVVVVRGYRGEAVACSGVRFVDNDEFATTGELWSLAKAKGELAGRVLVLYGDILVDRAVVQRLLATAHDNAVVVDRAWRREPRTSGARPDLVLESDPPAVSYRYVPSDAPGRVIRIGPDLPPHEAHGEFAGMALFADGAVLRPFLDGDVRRAKLTDLLQWMVLAGRRVGVVETYKGWMDVDTLADLRRADAREATA
jgi:phosphoenolpyruvate phosphomutase